MILALAVAVVAAGQPEPTDQALIYYNARMALREDRALEAVKLWMLRGAVEDQTGRVSAYDADFASVTWAALGELGVCQDGHPNDSEGAGLWPLGLHNWVVRNMGRRIKVKRPRPFDAFRVGRQQRFVSINDVLSAQELDTVRLFRGSCLRPRLALQGAGESLTAKLSDRHVTARLLEYLLLRARTTLALERVRGWATIEARLFDIALQRTALAASEARRATLDAQRAGREAGLTRESLAVMREEAPVTTLPPDSEPARILAASVHWPVTEWMALSPDRRRFLYDHARAQGGDPAKLDAIALGIVDVLIAEGEGAEAEEWIARRAPADDAAAQAVIWSDDRGRRLLALGREAGFRERGVIALHRGVHHLEQGELPEALRAVAFALQQSADSREGERLQNLSRRWLSYVASRFAIDDELLITLQELVPRPDYARILEDLMWRAAFYADQTSFTRGLENQGGRGALERRIDLLRPLAAGDVGGFTGGIGRGLDASPSETLRFLDQLVQRLELEDAGVRASQRATVIRVRALLEPLAVDDGANRRHARSSGALSARFQAILEGIGGLEPDASGRDRARAMAPTGEVFAGSVRLAPADPVPWPFHASEAPAPSIFTPIDLVPQEWGGIAGDPVFGWWIGG